MGDIELDDEICSPQTLKTESEFFLGDVHFTMWFVKSLAMMKRTLRKTKTQRYICQETTRECTLSYTDLSSRPIVAG